MTRAARYAFLALCISQTRCVLRLTELKAAAHEVKSKVGALDVLIINAGICGPDKHLLDECVLSLIFSLFLMV